MQVLQSEHALLTLSLTLDEGAILQAALNEVCFGLELLDKYCFQDFSTQIGLERVRAQALLELVHAQLRPYIDKDTFDFTSQLLLRFSKQEIQAMVNSLTICLNIIDSNDLHIRLGYSQEEMNTVHCQLIEVLAYDEPFFAPSKAYELKTSSPQNFKELKTYLMTYDVARISKSRDRASREAYSEFYAVIDSLATKHWYYMPNACLMQSKFSVEEISFKLETYLEATDQLFIVAVTGEWH